MRTRRHLSALALVATFTSHAQAAPPKIIPGIAKSSEIGPGPDSRAVGGLLSKSARCAAVPDAAALPEGCESATSRGVFGVSADGMAYLVFGPAIRSSCMSEGEVTIERTALVKGSLSKPTSLFRHAGCEVEGVDDTEACVVAQTRAVWKALDKLAKEGFRDLPDLAGARLEGEAGIQAARPAAVLGAPFTGWMLYLKDERTRSKIMLVDPQNERAIAIGRRLCSENEPYPDAPADEHLSDCFGSIEHVALTADRKGLILSTSYHDGGHCSPHELITTRLWLSKDVQTLLVPPKPKTP